MADVWKEPSEQEQQLANLAANDILEVVNRLVKEGIDPRVVIAAMGSATCDTITSIFRITAASPWFLQQAIMVNQLTGKQH
jgi:hypothetical protein